MNSFWIIQSTGNNLQIWYIVCFACQMWCYVLDFTVQQLLPTLYYYRTKSLQYIRSSTGEKVFMLYILFTFLFLDCIVFLKLFSVSLCKYRMTQPFVLASLIGAFALNLNDSMSHQICNPQRQEQHMSVTMTTRLLGDSGALCEVCCRLFCPCVAELVLCPLLVFFFF